MSIKQHYENAYNAIVSERQRETEVARQRVIQDVVAPHNREIDVALAKAIQEQNTACNEEIAKIQQKYANERQALEEMAFKKKQDFEQTTVAAEVARVGADYDLAISNLAKLIGEKE